ncbi:MAG: hypothetical protein WCI02_07255 [Planctomycetota bacterium]
MRQIAVHKDFFHTTFLEYIPALEGAGRWGKANKVFDGNLKELLIELNAALAA